MKYIKMWRWIRSPFSSVGDSYTTNIKHWDGQTFSEEDKLEEGYWLTKDQIEEVFAAGAAFVAQAVLSEDDRKTAAKYFNDYWGTKE